VELIAPAVDGVAVDIGEQVDRRGEVVADLARQMTQGRANDGRQIESRQSPFTA